MVEASEKCRCGAPLQFFDPKVGFYWCDHCDRPEHDPRYQPKPSS